MIHRCSGESMTRLLILCLILLNHESGHSIVATEEPKSNSFSSYYRPWPQEQVRLARAITAGSLSGTVLDSDGFPIPDAIVERVSHTWEAAFDERKTHSNGRFSFGKMPKGRYFLRVSKLGFNTLLVKVITTNDSKAKLKLSLQVSR
jgi:hypothetical protein